MEAFDAGAAVEVWLDDGGGWYEATVVQRQRKRYKLQLSSSPEKPRIVPTSSVRPRYLSVTPATSYSLGDLVEALHNGAWRPGVVSAAVQPGRYTVTFPTSPLTVQFKIKQMRPHVHWRHAQSFLCGDQERGAMFGEGDRVEVYYASAWFPGTIMEIISKTIFLVEYNKPEQDDGCSCQEILFKEFLDARHIRPVPPRPPLGKPFKVHDEIEVCRSGGWTAGSVTKIIKHGSKYIVKLKYGTEEEKEVELHHSEVWIRRNWTKGRWIPATKLRGQPSLAGKKPDQPIRVSTSTTSSDDDQLNKTVLKRKMGEGPGCEGQGESLQPSKELRKGESSNQLCMEVPKTPTAAMQGFESPLVLGTSVVKPGLQQIFAFDELCGEQGLSKFSSTTELVDVDEGSSNSKGGRSEKLSSACNINQSFMIHETGATKRGNCKPVSDPSVNVPKKRTKLAVRRLRKCQEASNVIDRTQKPEEETEKKRGIGPKGSIENNIVMNVACKELQERSEVVNQSNQGVPPVLSNGLQLTIHQDEVMVCENALAPIDIKDSLDNNASSPQTNKQVDKLEAHLFTPQMMSYARDYTLADHLSVRKLLTSISSSFITQVQGISNFVNGPNDIGIDVENQSLVVPVKENCAIARSNSVDLMVHEIPNFRNKIDVAVKAAENMSHKSKGNAAIHAENTYNMTPSKTISVEAASINPAPTRPCPIKTLPFVKNSSLWESIESMEVFRIMPQEPHFRPLEQYCRYFREGMAIGFMVTFANLVAKVRKLYEFNSHATIEEISESLVPLEESGFDVGRIRSCLENLLEVRNIQKELENKKATLKQQIYEKDNENDRLKASQAALDKTIKETEQHLAILRESRNSRVMELTNIGSEIAKLQTDVEKIRKACLFYEKSFDRILASLW